MLIRRRTLAEAAPSSAPPAPPILAVCWAACAPTTAPISLPIIIEFSFAFAGEHPGGRTGSAWQSKVVADRRQGAAVDFPLRAVDVARFIGKQEADHVTDLARLADAVEGGGLAKLLHPFLDAVE